MTKKLQKKRQELIDMLDYRLRLRAAVELCLKIEDIVFEYEQKFPDRTMNFKFYVAFNFRQDDAFAVIESVLKQYIQSSIELTKTVLNPLGYEIYEN